MIYTASLRSVLRPDVEDTSILRKQIMREISCLELQLERLRRRDEHLDITTVQTYEEMISARKDMIDSLYD